MFARAINAQGHNLRLEIWLAGCHIAIYDEFGKQLCRLRARRCATSKEFSCPQANGFVISEKAP